MVGRVFGRYQLGRRLGAGGMAVVYQALLTGPSGFNRPCVVKRIHPRLAHNNDFAKMFASEARLSALLQHPNIVQILEFGAVEDELFLAMEYIQGADLVNVFRRCIAAKRTVPIGVACFAMHELASALGYAHALKGPDGRPLSIVHRDVSPSNVMLTQQGGVKLVDFGIAKAAGHIRDDLTRTGTLKGKVGYMSPEQAEAEQIDQRSDIFSLGVVFHEMLTCQRVFRGQDDLQTLKKIREANPPPPSQIRPEVPPEVDAVVMKMLTRRPEDRYQSCEEVREAIAPIVHEMQADGRQVSSFLASLPAAAEETPSNDRDTLDPDVPRSARSGGAAAAIPTVANKSDPSSRDPISAPRSGERKHTMAVSREHREPRRRLPVILASAVGALALVGLAWFGQRHLGHQRVANSGRPAVTATPPTKPAADPVVTQIPTEITDPQPIEHPATPGQVTVEITGTLGAHVFDGERSLGTLPLSLKLDAAPGTRVLSIRKSGYRTATRTIAADANAALEVHLDHPTHARTPAAADGVLKNPFDR
jgi:serine/threonine protein kinase